MWDCLLAHLKLFGVIYQYIIQSDFFFLFYNFLLCLFSINTVYYMAPFATMILGFPAILLEGNGVMDWFHTHQSVCSSLIIIFSSGVLAFCLNFSIFYVIHSTTAVTFNVAGNLKVRPNVKILIPLGMGAFSRLEPPHLHLVALKFLLLLLMNGPAIYVT